MTDTYLRQVLATQDLTPEDVAALQSLRDRIQGQLAQLEGAPRFYYGGSYAKRTMIRARYDLDIVVYWPSAATFTIKGIYDGVGNQLRQYWKNVNPKTVAWELPFDGGFHIDIVPGRALDASFYEANLYRADTGTTLKTSLKKHIDSVRGSGRADVIRLMKLWKIRNNIPFKKSFALELMTIEGAKGRSFTDLAQQMVGALSYVRDNIMQCNVIDPANSNNALSDDIDWRARSAIHRAASAAINAPYWSDVFKL